MWVVTARHGVASVLRRSWRASFCIHQHRGLAGVGSPSKARQDEDGIPRGGAAEVAARGWQISAESESDWRSHAAAVARSVDLIKARLQVWSRARV